MHMQHIYVVRHGQSQANASKHVTGSRNSPLTELGRAQARLAGKSAKDLHIDLIVASPLSRAHETARIIAEEIGYPPADIRLIDGLHERSLGTLEGTSYAENERLNGNYPETETFAGIEPLAQLHARVHDIWHDLLRDKTHKNILIVCHMNIGRMLETILHQQAPETIYDQPRLDNAKIYQLI